MHIVTGGCGFIGSNLVKQLNKIGVKDIIVVDDLQENEKFLNIVDCDIHDLIDKSKFLSSIESGALDLKIDTIFHQGACSDTMETNGTYMLENNVSLTVRDGLVRLSPHYYNSQDEADRFFDLFDTYR